MDALPPEWTESQDETFDGPWPTYNLRRRHKPANWKRRAMQHLTDAELDEEWFWRKQNKLMTGYNLTYKANYPNYCRTCNGWGGWQHQESHGETLFDACDDCLGRDICPRCGRIPIYDEDQFWLFGLDDHPCTWCGWTLQDGGLRWIET